MTRVSVKEERAAQVRLICEGYGLEQKKRARLTEQILEVIICEAAHEAIDPGLTFEARGPLWGLRGVPAACTGSGAAAKLWKQRCGSYSFI